MADIEQLARDMALFREDFGRFTGAMSERMDGFEKHLGEVHGEVKEIARCVYESDIEKAEQRGAAKAKTIILTGWREWITPVIAIFALLISVYDRLRAILTH